MKKKPEKTGAKTRIRLLWFVLAVFLPLLPGCETGGGETDDSDEEPAAHSYTKTADIARVIDSWSGVWYSHYGGKRLDGYRIGKWKDRHSLIPPEKAALFPGLDLDAPRFLNYSGLAYDAANDFPGGLDDAYFIFCDDTVYGEGDDSTGGNSGWGDIRYRYLGIVKAVNTFAANDSGAVIIQYLEGCSPSWDEDFAGPPPHCYFGVYYRVRDQDTIYLANAVVLDNLYNGEKYYTETATLDEAVAKNTEENGVGFISWGVVMPQEREPAP
jgi:hypothetical protein